MTAWRGLWVVALFAGAVGLAGVGGLRLRRAVLLGMLAADRPHTSSVPADGRRAAPRSVALNAVAAWWYALSRRTLVVGGLMGCALAAGLGGAFAAILAAAAWTAAALTRWAHGLRAQQRYDRALLVLVEGIGRQLRSGATIAAALSAAGERAPGPVGEDLAAVRRALGAGATVEEAMRGWAALRPWPTVQLVCAALALGASSGGLRARMVDELAQSLRQIDGARREAAALAGQAQASAVVMVVAPLLFAALLAAGDGAARHFLTRQPLGLCCLAAGLALDLAAAAAMARIVAGAP